MEIDSCCNGHGLTRAGLLGRSAAAAWAAVAGSASWAGVAQASQRDARRRIPRAGEVPDTRLARAVGAFAAKVYPRFLADHCRRSYEVAVLIAAADRIPVDLDVLYAGVLLHDLGLTAHFHSPDARFEIASANAACSFVRSHGLPSDHAEQVWDVVVLHGTGGIAAFKSAETAIAADGIGRDVTGLGLDQFPKDAIARIMATRPGFAKPFIDAVVTDLKHKPQVANGTWMMSIAEAHIHSFKPTSVETLAFQDPYETARH